VERLAALEAKLAGDGEDPAAARNRYTMHCERRET
jgi:hypothetical protein